MQTELAMLREIVGKYLERYPLVDSETGEPLLDFDPRDTESFRNRPVKPKPGRPFELEDDRLKARRDRMLQWLTVLANRVEPALNIARSAKELQQQLDLHLPNRDGDETFQRLKHDGCKVLWSFLQSRRWTRKPKQMADAMAGVPEIAWRTSIDRCAKLPVSEPEDNAW